MNNYEVNGETVEGPTHFILPDESYKNVAMLDWIMATKAEEDELASLFNDCLVQQFESLTESSQSLSQLAPLLAHSGMDVKGRN